MDDASVYTSGGTSFSFYSCPLAVITREPLPQCAVDRGFPAIYRARFYLDGDFRISDECLYPDPEDTYDGESPTLSQELNVMVISNDAGSPPVNAAYGDVDEEDYLRARGEVGNPEEIAHGTLLGTVQEQMFAHCYRREWDGKQDLFNCILSDDGTYPGYENAYFGVTDCL